MGRIEVITMGLIEVDFWVSVIGLVIASIGFCIMAVPLMGLGSIERRCCRMMPNY